MKAGHFVFVGIPGPQLDGATAALLAEIQPGGLVLFRRNLESAEQLVELVAALRKVLPEAVLAIDAEGGRVDRFSDLLGPAPAASLLARRPPVAAQRAGRWIGLALRLFEIELDFAPVVDLDYGESHNALDGRYLGGRDKAVTRRARAFLRGLHSSGIGGCLKHFPGLGAAAEDTHFRTSVVRLSATQLAPHLKPYASLLPLASAAMIAHAVYPALDPDQRPASLSPPVIEKLLRGQLGFDGLVLSDDLEMKALAEWGDLPVRAEEAFVAGCDVVLACETLDALPEIVRRIGKPRYANHRREAGRRLAAYRRRLRTLRWSSSAVSLVRARGRMAELKVVRDGLQQLMQELEA